MKIARWIFAALVALLPAGLLAADGAVSLPAGGLTLAKPEPRITVARQAIAVSLSRLEVDYELRNDSDAELSVEISFPVPDYTLAMYTADPERRSFESFRLWVDGAPATFETEAKGFVGEREITKLLTQLKLDIASFGRADDYTNGRQIKHLSIEEKISLGKAGGVDAHYNDAAWKVRKRYYWTQRFPAHATVHIRHEYKPAVGAVNSYRNEDAENHAMQARFCPDEHLQGILGRTLEDPSRDIVPSWVDYTLTSASTWKLPIEDFSITVERSHSVDSLANYVSFCWDGPVERADADHFAVHVKNFTPSKDLSLGFFAVIQTAP